MKAKPDVPDGDRGYFDESAKRPPRVFDAALLEQRVELLPTRVPIVFSPSAPVKAAIEAMQRHHRGCVLVTETGATDGRTIGIFTDRDVLHRVVDQERDPTTLELREVMTSEPECMPREAPIAWILNQMAAGEFRHVPIVDGSGRPVFVVSVRDIVQFLVEVFPQEILNLPPSYCGDRFKSREGA